MFVDTERAVESEWRRLVNRWFERVDVEHDFVQEHLTASDVCLMAWERTKSYPVPFHCNAMTVAT